MNKMKYYLIQWTWGLPINIIGALVFFVAKILGWRTYSWRKAVCIVLPKDCGGALNLGMFLIRGPIYENSLPHEYGHSIQNMQWGWLYMPVIWIPSVLRFWIYTFHQKFIYPKTRKSLPSYYSIWFEKQASKYGRTAKQNKWNWL